MVEGQRRVPALSLVVEGVDDRVRRLQDIRGRQQHVVDDPDPIALSLVVQMTLVRFVRPRHDATIGQDPVRIRRRLRAHLRRKCLHPQ